MCCGRGGDQCPGGILYVVEKVTSFAALTAVVVCIMITLGITLGLGIGLGYNYCFVDLKVVTESSGSDETGGSDGLRSVTNGDEQVQGNAGFRRNLATSPPTPPKRTVAMSGFIHTMAIPLHADVDFPSLLAKLRNRNKNVTLELFT